MDAVAPETRPPADPAVRIRVLGAIEVARGGEAPQRLRGRPAHLLGVLVEAAPRGIPRSDLIDQLWDPAAGDAGGLDPILSRLRRLVGPIEGRGEVRLASPPESDVAEARSLLQAANAAWPADAATALHGAARAAELLADELLPGIDDPWVAERRRRLALDRDAARTLVARAALELGGDALDRGVGAAASLVATDPLDEVGYELLMRCQLAAGREGSAMSTYARLEETLAGAHGGRPGRVLRALREVASRAPRDGAASSPLPPALARERRIPLVGRGAELARIVGACTASDGPALVLVEGESGIGKSRLLAELAAELVERDAVVLHGRSFPIDPLPFGAMQQALRGVEGARFGALDGPASHADPPPVGAGTAAVADLAARRFQAFNQIAAALADAAAARRGPITVLLDDAQWLDPSSIELLGHLLRAPQLARLRLVLATRPVDGPDHPAAIVRQLVGDATALTLEGPSPLMRRSAEDLGVSINDAADLGAATSIALQRAELAARQLVHLVAIGGDSLTVAEVAAVTGASTEEVATLAALAVADGLLEEPDDPRGAGRLHDARRRAVIGATPAGAVRSAHRSIAGALESLLDDDDGRNDEGARGEGPRDEEAGLAWIRDYGARLAGHWRQAGGAVALRRAADYGARAAEFALSSLAFERAALLAAQARADLRASAHRADRPAGSELSLLLLQGQALNAASRLTAAAPVWLEAIELAGIVGTPEEQAVAVLGLAGPRLGGAVQVPGLRAALEAALARPPADPALQARLRARLAGELFDGPVDRRRGLSDEAIVIAAGSGDDAALAEALLLRHLVKICDAESEGRSELVDDAERVARRAGRLDLALHARMLRFSDLVEGGAIVAAEEELAAWEAEAHDAQLPYNRWAAAICAPTIALARCDLPGALEALARADRLAAPLGDDWMVRSASGGHWLSIQIVQGDIMDLRAVLGPLVEAGGAMPVWSVALAMGELIAGDDALALDLVSEALDLAAAGSLVDLLRLPVLSFLAIIASTAGAPAHQLEGLRTVMEPHAATWATQHYGSGTHGPLALRIALLDVALGDTDRAARRIAPYGPASGESHGDLVDLAVTQVQARLLAATGQPDAARDLHRALADASRAGGAHGWAALFERECAPDPAIARKTGPPAPHA